MRKFGICFSKKFEEENPLGHIIGFKFPVYIRLLELCQKEGWDVYVLTKRTYKGNGVFAGAWLFRKGKFLRKKESLEIDIVYDRTGGVEFPLDDGLAVVNRRDFKILCWDKWAAYKKIGKYMPKTYWVGGKKNLEGVLEKIKGEWIVLKPYNGQKGIGVFIGPKSDASNFNFSKRKYIAQEFVDTSAGIFGITAGLHDLRVTIVNGKAVWSHVRVPPVGSFKANLGEGGKLSEIDYQKVPFSVKKIVEEISEVFYQEFDNPVFSLDFGLQADRPFIFEMNDQIGFPRWEMKARNVFLKELVKNFQQKII